MYCKYCGVENPKDAKYCKNCGMKLEKNQFNVSKSQKNGLLSIWDQRNPKWIFSVILVSMFVILLFVSISNSSNQNSAELPVETYGNDNGTFYSGEYFSFSHRIMDSIGLGDKNSSSNEIFFADADPTGDNLVKNYAFGLIIYKPENATKSAFEYVKSDKNGNEDIGVTTYPIKRIQIAGVTGYQYDYDYIYSDAPSYTDRDIFFVKKGLLYKISFTTPLNEMVLYQKDIDEIVNSFSVK